MRFKCSYVCAFRVIVEFEPLRIGKSCGLRSPDIVYYETKKRAHFDNVALRRATIYVMSGIESAGSRGL